MGVWVYPTDRNDVSGVRRAPDNGFVGVHAAHVVRLGGGVVRWIHTAGVAVCAATVNAATVALSGIAGCIAGTVVCIAYIAIVCVTQVGVVVCCGVIDTR